MDDKASGAWIVSVTTQGRGNQLVEFFCVAEAAPISAEHAVSKHIDAMDEKIEAIERLPRSVVGELGLNPGEIRKCA